MPKHIPKETTQSLRTSAGSTWLLTRPVTLDLAKRLQANCFQIMALNEANKSLEDASSALGLEMIKGVTDNFLLLPAYPFLNFSSSVISTLSN